MLLMENEQKNVSNYNKNQIWPQNFALIFRMQEMPEGVLHSLNELRLRKPDEVNNSFIECFVPLRTSLE